ncbi:MAG: beta-galactosidase, partial [Victivallales bacterium]|nr:beta-galactosidase [Victivallales bacterium]
GVKVLPKEERKKTDEANDDWQFQWSDEFKTPHFDWLNGNPFKVMFLLPTNGIRDCIELKQRMPMIIPTIPTIYPNSWQMSWRVQTDTMSGEKTGLRFLPQYFGESDKYDVIVIGGDGYIAKDRTRMLWKVFPEAIRKNILDRVRNGAGLVIINPMGTDTELDGILKGLEPLPEAFAASMDYSAAPHFPKTVMSTGMLGKGRVIHIKYPEAGYIAPHPGNRRYNLQLLSQSHRFQEYQFGILARLINYARGVEPSIRSVKVEDGLLKVVGKTGGIYDVFIYDRWSEPIGTKVIKDTKGTGEAEAKIDDDLGEGRFYVHVLTEDDFGFVSFDVKRVTKLKSIQMAKSFDRGEHAVGKIEASGMELNDELQNEIYDNVGRLVWQGSGAEIDWDCANAVVSRHVLKARILRDGKVISERHHEFYLPDVWENVGHFVSNIWSGYPFPEYAYPYINDQIWRLGASYIFSSRNEECSYLFNLSNMEPGITWISSSSMFHNKSFFSALDQWSKTGDKKFLVKPYCPSNPENDRLLVPSLPDRMKLWGTRHFFQLGDEMSMGWYTGAYDLCFCEFCLKGLREEMKAKYGDIAALNKSWATDFKDWEEVMPMTYAEAMLHASPAPWVEHRLYMDKVFIQAVTKIMDRIKAEYPGAWTGPSGTKGTPAVYGGNWNFWNTRNVNYTTYYGTPRIQLSFNRDRIVMCHYGYSSTEISTRFSFMEQIFVGNKGINTWWSPTFVMPDLRIAGIRKYYQDLTWECRNGFGEILFHSKPVAPKVAILHSQPALISNFMKQRKTDYHEKELAYAMVLEDLGIPYRFIAPAEMGRLNEFEALFLPEATAMSDEEIAAV